MMWKCIKSNEPYFIEGKVYGETPEGFLHDEDSTGRIWKFGSNPHRLARASDWEKHMPDIIFKNVSFEIYLNEIEQ